MSKRRTPKTTTRTVHYQDQADLGLRGVLTDALGREPTHDIRFNRKAIQVTGRGAGSVVLYSVSSRDSNSGAEYGDTRRGLIEVASQVAALQEEEAFHVTAENFVATLVGLHVECEMVTASGEQRRKGLTRSPDDGHKAKLTAEGVIPVLRARNDAGHKAMVACEPVDSSDPRWAKAIAAMAELNSQYGGFLGQDENATPRTAAEVCADVVERQEKMRERNRKAKASAEADKDAGLVKMKAMKATKGANDAFLKTAAEQGVDVEDPESLGEFACACAVLAYAKTQKAKAKKSA